MRIPRHPTKYYLGNRDGHTIWLLWHTAWPHGQAILFYPHREEDDGGYMGYGSIDEEVTVAGPCYPRLTTAQFEVARMLWHTHRAKVQRVKTMPMKGRKRQKAAP